MFLINHLLKYSDQQFILVGLLIWLFGGNGDPLIFSIKFTDIIFFLVVIICFFLLQKLLLLFLLLQQKISKVAK